MLTLSDAHRYFLYRNAADMRKSFYTLAALVKQEMNGDPLSGDIFIFLSRRRSQIKLLRWEKDGFAIYMKRLEKGTYELPVEHQESSFHYKSSAVTINPSRHIIEANKIPKAVTHISGQVVNNFYLYIVKLLKSFVSS